MSQAKAICEEFCDRVEVSMQLVEVDYVVHSIEEVRCALKKEYFPELFKRMKTIGYCCTQVQNNAKFKRCVAWVEAQDSNLYKDERSI